MITFLKPEEQHQHKNGGGWVANTVTIDDSVYVAPTAQVSGNAQVFGNAWVSGNARVFGDAWVYGNAQVSDDARVFGDARVYGDARVSGNARVYGDAWVETPLFIQGTRHGISNSKHGYLSIGCVTLTFAEWKKQFRAIGKREGYTTAQIKEYGRHIAYATRVGK